MPDKIRYYRVDARGVAYWRPGAQADGLSLSRSVALGRDGPDARAAAVIWNGKLDDARKGTHQTLKYPPGTFGRFYEMFRRKEAWSTEQARTREDYDRAWPIIEKRFGMRPILAITADHSERFHIDLHPSHPPNKKRDPDGKLKLSWNEAHRVLKVWRALMNGLVRYELRPVAPIGGVSNPQPKGRDGLWRHDEVMRLTYAAAVLGKFGMAAAIRLAWCCMLAPVDVWTLNKEHWRTGAGGVDLATHRKKTKKRVLHAVDADTLAFLHTSKPCRSKCLPTAG